MTAAGLTHRCLSTAASSPGGRNSQFLFITWVEIGGKEGNTLIFNSSISPGPEEQALAQRGGCPAACAQEHPYGQGCSCAEGCGLFVAPHSVLGSESMHTMGWEQPRDPVQAGDMQGGQCDGSEWSQLC